MNTIKAIIGILVIVGGIYLGIQAIPPYFYNYQFKDDLVQIAQFGSANLKSEEDIRNEVLKKAASYNLPVRAEQVQVTREGGDVGISVNYNVVVNLVGGRKWTMNFTPATESKSLTKLR
jgi:uncharacterized protein DUF4845